MKRSDVKFWMVLGIGPSSGMPKYKHELELSAINEAERLAGQNPGTDFYVLQATHVSRKVNIETVELIESDCPSGENIPF
jgi:hypothetical protein